MVYLRLSEWPVGRKIAIEVVVAFLIDYLLMSPHKTALGRDSFFFKIGKFETSAKIKIFKI